MKEITGNSSPAIPLVQIRHYFAWCCFAMTLAVCMAWILFHAYLVDSVTVRMCREWDASLIQAEKSLPVFLNYNAFDGYIWNSFAEEIGNDGSWRLRHTGFDNHPAGREVHWNSAFAWYLRGLGEIHMHSSGEPLRNSIFRMSIWANPALLLVCICLIGAVTALACGPVAAVGVTVGMIVVKPFFEGFLPAYPDHHGLIAAAGLGLLLGIVIGGAGWIPGPATKDEHPARALRNARFGMVFSAISGAAGLWFSALSSALLLASLGIAVLAAMLLNGYLARAKGFQFRPDLWKLWGVCGAGASSLFYFLEYAPNHFGLRLEVNHPLYAIAWLGGAWIVAIFGAWLAPVDSAKRKVPLRGLAVAAGALALLPAAVVLLGAGVFAPLDPFVAGWHKSIIEFNTLSSRLQSGDLTLWSALGWFPVMLASAIVISLQRRVDPRSGILLAALAFVAMLVHALQLYQSRWVMLAGPVYVVLAGLVAQTAWDSLPAKRFSRWSAAGVLLVLTLLALWDAAKTHLLPSWDKYVHTHSVRFTSAQARALLHRDIAITIRDEAGDDPVVILGSPNSSCLVAGFGGFKTLGTFYWENTGGLRAAARILCAQGDSEALQLLRAHGVTHIVLLLEGNFMNPFFSLIRKDLEPGASLQQSLGYRLLIQGQVPAWARSVGYGDNVLTRALNERVVILRVTPPRQFER